MDDSKKEIMALAKDMRKFFSLCDDAKLSTDPMVKFLKYLYVKAGDRKAYLSTLKENISKIQNEHDRETAVITCEWIFDGDQTEYLIAEIGRSGAVEVKPEFEEQMEFESVGQEPDAGRNQKD